MQTGGIHCTAITWTSPTTPMNITMKTIMQWEKTCCFRNMISLVQCVWLIMKLLLIIPGLPTSVLAVFMFCLSCFIGQHLVHDYTKYSVGLFLLLFSLQREFCKLFSPPLSVIINIFIIGKYIELV